MIYDTVRGASRELVLCFTCHVCCVQTQACSVRPLYTHTNININVYLSRCANTIIPPTKQFSTYIHSYVFSYSTTIIEFDRMPKMQIIAHYIIFYCMRLRTSAEVVTQASEYPGWRLIQFPALQYSYKTQPSLTHTNERIMHAPTCIAFRLAPTTSASSLMQFMRE